MPNAQAKRWFWLFKSYTKQFTGSVLIFPCENVWNIKFVSRGSALRRAYTILESFSTFRGNTPHRWYGVWGLQKITGNNTRRVNSFVVSISPMGTTWAGSPNLGTDFRKSCQGWRVWTCVKWRSSGIWCDLVRGWDEDGAWIFLFTVGGSLQPQHCYPCKLEAIPIDSVRGLDSWQNWVWCTFL